MRIGLIGCGRVGVTLFCLLKKNNTIVGVHDRNRQRERSAARLLKIESNPPYHGLIDRCEAIFLATPDDEILKAYARMRKYTKGTKYVFHFSGILAADIIPRTHNAYRASVHPFATFPRIAVPAGNAHYHLSIEGDAQALRACRKIFSKKNFTLKRIRKKDKTLYHLVGVFSSNLLVALVSSAGRIAGRIGWKREEIRQMMIPIIEQTIRNIERYGIEGALSGPLQRGDTGVVKKHLAALRYDKDLIDVYRSLSRAMLDRRSVRSKPALKSLLR